MTTTAHEDQTTPAPVEVTVLACAHCGSEALIGQTLDDAWYAMCCVDHCIRIDKYWHTKAEAIAAWNTRHSAPAGLYSVPKLSSGSVKASTEGQLFNAAHSAPAGEVEPVAVNRQWAVSLANVRQGRSSTPRCEPPGECDIERAADIIRDVLAASPPLYTHPAPPADVVEALRAAKAAMDEYYRYWTGGETRGSYDGKPERAALWAARERARAALSKHTRAQGEG